MKCWKCGTKIKEKSIHHINRNPEDENLSNKISLCRKCHDLVQAICDNCMDQSNCHVRKFRMCWQFENAIPPIYFSVASPAVRHDRDMNSHEKKSIISINSAKCG